MTANAIIKETEQLPGKKLSKIAQRMAGSNDSDKVKMLRAEIHRGFYGE